MNLLTISQNNKLILTYPLGLTNGAVAASLLTHPDITTNSFYFLTSNPQQITTNLAQGESFPPQIFIDYNNTLHIQQVLASDTLFIIDSLVELIQQPTILNLFKQKLNPKLKLIFLAGWGLTANIVKQIKQIFPNIIMAQYSLIINQIPELQIEYDLTQLSSIQQPYYDSYLQYEQELLLNGDHRHQYYAQNHIYVKQVANCIYPHDININTLPDQDVSKAGWMTKDFMNKVRIYGPKMAKLIQNIIMQPDKSRVIYSHYSDRYGLDLIATLLEYLDIGYVYINANLFSIAERHKLIDIYHTNPDIKICLTSLPDIGKRIKTDYLDILEGCNYETLMSLLHNCYYLQYGHTLKVLLYCSYTNTQHSVDVELFEQCLTKFSSYWDYYQQMLQTAKLIQIDPKLGAIITD